MIVYACGSSAGTVHLAAAGEIDLATSADFEAALSRALRAEGTTQLIVDFAEVDFCDSTGIAALDRLFGEADRRGIVLRIARPQRGVYRLLEITGIAERLTGGA